MAIVTLKTPSSPSRRGRLLAEKFLCDVCQQELHRSLFTLVELRRSGQRRCKNCRREWTRSPDNRAKNAIRMRKRNYGITDEEFQSLIIAQHNVCAICGEDPPETKHGKWHVDHNHETGKVRGLLCQNCNLGLGRFKDNPAALQSAIYYLALHDET